MPVLASWPEVVLMTFSYMGYHISPLWKFNYHELRNI